MINTRTSFTDEKKNFLNISILVLLICNPLVFVFTSVKPETNKATSSPNLLAISSIVIEVSSIQSCNKAAITASCPIFS